MGACDNHDCSNYVSVMIVATMYQCLQYSTYMLHVLGFLGFFCKEHKPGSRQKNENKEDNKVACRESEETTRTQKLRVDRTNNY